MSDVGESQARAHAPAPDDPRKPETPPKLRGPSWRYGFGKAIHEFSRDHCTDRAGALTYYGILSIFPGILAVFSILNLVGAQKTVVSFVLTLVRQVAPSDSAHALGSALQGLTQTPAAGIGAISGIVLAIWTASGYIRAFGRALNVIYEVDEGRPAWKLYPSQLLVTVVVIVLVIVMLAIVALSGPVVTTIGDALHLGPAVTFTWLVVKWPLLAAAVIVMIAALYYGTPNTKQPSFRWISLGSLLAFIIIVLASAGFAFYVANFANYSKSYGSLGGVVIFLVWGYLVNVVLLFGAEFDAEIERARELQAGIQAEETIQLPPRDTRQSEKAEKKLQRDVQDGRELRVNSTTED